MRYCCGSIDLRGENFTSREEHEIEGRIKEFFRGRVKLEVNFNSQMLDIIIHEEDWPHPPSNGDYHLIALSRQHKSITVRLRSPSNHISRGRPVAYGGATISPPSPLTWEPGIEELSVAAKFRAPSKPVVSVAPTRSKKLLLI